MKEIPTIINVYIAPGTKLCEDRIGKMLYLTELRHVITHLVSKGILQKISSNYEFNIDDTKVFDSLPKDLCIIDESRVCPNYPFIELNGNYYLLRYNFFS